MAVVQGYPTEILYHPTQDAFLTLSCLPTTSLLGSAGDGIISLVNNTSANATMRVIAPSLAVTSVGDVRFTTSGGLAATAPNGFVIDTGVSADTVAVRLGGSVGGLRSDLRSTIGGSLTNLNTVNKTSLIGAINELESGVSGLGIIVDSGTGTLQAAIDAAIATRPSLDTWLVFFLRAEMYAGDVTIIEPNILIRGIAEDASFITNGSITINTATPASSVNDIILQSFSLIVPSTETGIGAASVFPLNVRIDHVHITKITDLNIPHITLRSDPTINLIATNLVCDVSGSNPSYVEICGGTFDKCKFLNTPDYTQNFIIAGSNGSEFVNCTFVGQILIQGVFSTNPNRFTGCFLEASGPVILFTTDYGATLYNCTISTNSTVMLDVTDGVSPSIKYYGIIPSKYDPVTNTSVFLVSQANETCIKPLPVFGGGMDIGPRSTLIASNGSDISWTWRNTSSVERDGLSYMASY